MFRVPKLRGLSSPQSKLTDGADRPPGGNNRPYTLPPAETLQGGLGFRGLGMVNAGSVQTWDSVYPGLKYSFRVLRHGIWEVSDNVCACACEEFTIIVELNIFWNL